MNKLFVLLRAGWKKIVVGGRAKAALLNTLWQVGDKVLRMVVGLTIGIWVARYLQPEGFGLLNYAIAFVGLLSAFSTYGMQGVMVRELAKRPEDRDCIVASGVGLRLVTSSLSVLMLCALISFFKPNDSDTFLMVFVVSLSLVPQAWDVIEYYYQSEVNTRPVVIIKNISFVIFATFRIALVIFEAKLIWFAWVFSAEALVGSGSVWLLAKHTGFDFSPFRAKWIEIKYLLKTCWPAVVSGFSAMIYMRLDQVMLGQILTEADVGYFSAAVRISEAWYFVPGAIMGSLAPLLTRKYHENPLIYQRYLGFFIRGMFWLGVLVAILTSVVAHPLIDLLYGAHYEPAGDVLIVHAWAGVLVSVGIASSVWYVNHGFLKLQMIQTLCGGIANFLLNLWLIPAYGIVGAAFATVVAQIISTVLVNAFFFRTRELFKFQLSLFVPYGIKGSLA